MNHKTEGVLILEDGKQFWGTSVGAPGRAAGEVVVYTGMTGYQEVVTNPSSRDHIVAFTYPLIGNYGVNDEDAQSAHIHARGILVKEMCSQPSNWRSQGRLQEPLIEAGVIALTGIDTRALARYVRDKGAVRAVIAAGEDVCAEHPVGDEGGSLAQTVPQSMDLIRAVSTPRPYLFADGAGPRLSVLDYGVKQGLLAAFAKRGCRVTVLPFDASPKDVMATEPDGVVVSNGPGDPREVSVQNVEALVGHVPLFGVNLGHQLLARALGADIVALERAHRGGNLPVRDTNSGRTYLTAQSHRYAVQEGSWSVPEVIVSHVNGHDGSVEGLVHTKLPIASVQFHPEGAPGPQDAEHVIDAFVSRLGNRS